MTLSRTRKKVISTALVCALMVVLAVGATLAYMSTTTDTLTNNFTFLGSSDISASLTETQWVAANATNLSPNKTVAKNPQITNTSTATDMDEYVAMEVSFKTGSGADLTDEQFALLSQLITITWTTEGNWKTESGALVSSLTNIGSSATEIYYYDAVLYNDTTDGTVTTEALFTAVTINSNVTNAQLNWLSSTDTQYYIDDVAGLGGFQIIVNGAAVQVEGFDGNVTSSESEPTLAYSTLKSLFSSSSSSN